MSGELRGASRGTKAVVVLGLSLLLVMAIASSPLAVEGDIVFPRTVGTNETPPAVFPHWFHRIRFKCYVCHDAIFQMKQGANPVTMDAIQGGKFCGTCHNGKTAWAVSFETCNRCHATPQ